MGGLNSLKYTWKDLVYIQGQGVFSEEHSISGEHDDFSYEIDDFIEASALLHRCSEKDIKLWSIDGDDFAPSNVDTSMLPYGAESCGLYVNGIPEWHIEADLLDLSTEDLEELLEKAPDALSAREVRLYNNYVEIGNTIHHVDDDLDDAELTGLCMVGECSRNYYPLHSGKIVYLEM